MERRLRLRNGADFRRVRTGARRYSGRFLRLELVQGCCSHNRYGLVTGKHVGNAVQRNRARRLLREALRSLHPQLAPGHDLVVVSRPALAGATLEAAQEALKELLERAGLLNDGEDEG